MLITISVVTAAITALSPWPLKILVDFALGSGAVTSDPVQEYFNSFRPDTLVLLAGMGSLLVALLSILASSASNRTWAAVGHRMVYDLGATAFDTLQRLSLVTHSRRSVGDSLTRLTVDTYSVYSIASELFVSPAHQIISLVLVGFVAWSLDPGLTGVCLATAPLLAVSARFFGPRIKRRSRSDREAHSEVADHVHRTLSSIEIVKSFGREEESGQRFTRLARQAVAASQRKVLTRDSFKVAHGLVVALGNALVIGVGGTRILAGQLTVGALLVFMAYLQTMQKGVKGLLAIYGNLKSAEASVDRLIEILDSEDRIIELPGALPLPGSESPGQVSIEDVTFGYEAGRPVLEGVSVAFHPGEKVAIVGTTGAGKTTLLSLIPRFIDPWEGRVLIDGRDVRDHTLESVRNQVSLAFQEPLLLPVSIAENIAFGRPDATRAEIEAVADAAAAGVFIRELPEGFDTVVGERGSTLSGGQRQRISIARALLKDAPILILDEPTSSVDVETEKSLIEGLGETASSRTVLIVAHRLSTVRAADRILVLDRGSVAEEGSHEGLLAADGIYARLWAVQAKVGAEVAVP